MSGSTRRRRCVPCSSSRSATGRRTSWSTATTASASRRTTAPSRRWRAARERSGWPRGPGRDRDAQPSRVGRGVLVGARRGRRRRAAQRLVDRRRARLRPLGLGRQGAVLRHRALARLERPHAEALGVAHRRRRRRCRGASHRPPASPARAPERRTRARVPDLLGDVAADAVPPEVEVDPDDDATIFYTSGTTGRPKGAVGHAPQRLHEPHEPLLHRPARPAALRGPAAPSSSQNSFLLSVPLFHATGCLASMVVNTAAGGKLVMMHHFDPERALELIEREQITVFGGVPTMALQILDSPDFASGHLLGALGLLRRRARAARAREADQGGVPRRPARQRLRAHRDLGGDLDEHRARLRRAA